MLTIVTDDDRQRAPIATVPPGAPIPPQGTLEEHERLLESTRGGGYIGTVCWPICCGRLTTLHWVTEFDDLEAKAGRLNDCLLEACTKGCPDIVRIKTIEK